MARPAGLEPATSWFVARMSLFCRSLRVKTWSCRDRNRSPKALDPMRIRSMRRLAASSRGWVCGKGKKKATLRSDLRSLWSVVQDQQSIRPRSGRRPVLSSVKNAPNLRLINAGLSSTNRNSHVVFKIAAGDVRVARRAGRYAAMIATVMLTPADRMAANQPS